MSTKSSSLSARRHLNFVEQPYVGKIFYIDIKTASIRTKVVQRIQTLGGQIESFLSKDISVFITDRHEKRGDSPDESLERHSRINKCVPLSRGQTLLQRAANHTGSSTGNQGLLQNATNMGLKIQTVSTFLQSSSKQLAKLKAQKKTVGDDGTCGMSPISWDNEKENACRCYIKIEDEGSVYRPLFRQFEIFPKISYNGTDSPFDTGVALNRNTENQQAKKKSVGGVLRGGYCESCDHWYKCTLREHLNSEKHKDFIQSLENFKSLNEVTKSLPKFTAFVRELGLRKEGVENDKYAPESLELCGQENTMTEVLRSENEVVVQDVDNNCEISSRLNVCSINNGCDNSTKSPDKNGGLRQSVEHVTIRTQTSKLPDTQLNSDLICNFKSNSSHGFYPNRPSSGAISNIVNEMEKCVSVLSERENITSDKENAFKEDKSKSDRMGREVFKEISFDDVMSSILQDHENDDSENDQVDLEVQMIMDASRKTEEVTSGLVPNNSAVVATGCDSENAALRKSSLYMKPPSETMEASFKAEHCPSAGIKPSHSAMFATSDASTIPAQQNLFSSENVLSSTILFGCNSDAVPASSCGSVTRPASVTFSSSTSFGDNGVNEVMMLLKSQMSCSDRPVSGLSGRVSSMSSHDPATIGRVSGMSGQVYVKGSRDSDMSSHDPVTSGQVSGVSGKVSVKSGQDSGMRQISVANGQDLGLSAQVPSGQVSSLSSHVPVSTTLSDAHLNSTNAQLVRSEVASSNGTFRYGCESESVLISCNASEQNSCNIKELIHHTENIDNYLPELENIEGLNSHSSLVASKHEAFQDKNELLERCGWNLTSNNIVDMNSKVESDAMQGSEQVQKLLSFPHPDYSNITEESQHVPSLNKWDGRDVDDAEGIKTPSKDITQTLHSKIMSNAANSGSTIRNWLVNDEEALDSISTPVGQKLNDTRGERDYVMKQSNGFCQVDGSAGESGHSKVTEWIQKHSFDANFSSELSVQNFQDARKESYGGSSQEHLSGSRNTFDTFGVDTLEINPAHNLSVTTRTAENVVGEETDSHDEWSDQSTSISDCTLHNFRVRSNSETRKAGNILEVPKETDCASIKSGCASVRSGLSSKVTERGIRISGLAAWKCQNQLDATSDSAVNSSNVFTETLENFAQNKAQFDIHNVSKVKGIVGKNSNNINQDKQFTPKLQTPVNTESASEQLLVKTEQMSRSNKPIETVRYREGNLPVSGNSTASTVPFSAIQTAVNMSKSNPRGSSDPSAGHTLQNSGCSSSRPAEATSSLTLGLTGNPEARNLAYLTQAFHGVDFLASPKQLSQTVGIANGNIGNVGSARQTNRKVSLPSVHGDVSHISSPSIGGYIGQTQNCNFQQRPVSHSSLVSQNWLCSPVSVREATCGFVTDMCADKVVDSQQSSNAFSTIKLDDIAEINSMSNYDQLVTQPKRKPAKKAAASKNKKKLAPVSHDEQVDSEKNVQSDIIVTGQNQKGSFSQRTDSPHLTNYATNAPKSRTNSPQNNSPQCVPVASNIVQRNNSVQNVHQVHHLQQMLQNTPLGNVHQNAMQNVRKSGMQNVHQNAMQNVHKSAMHQNAMQNLHKNVMQNVRQNVMQNVHQNAMQNVHKNVLQNMHQNAIQSVHQSVIQSMHQNAMQNVQQNVMQNMHQTAMQNMHQNPMQNVYQTSSIQNGVHVFSQQRHAESTARQNYLSPNSSWSVLPHSQVCQNLQQQQQMYSPFNGYPVSTAISPGILHSQGFPNMQPQTFHSVSCFSPQNQSNYFLPQQVAYNAEQTGATKMTFRKIAPRPNNSDMNTAEQQNDLRQYWNVKKTGDCRLVFCMNNTGKRKAEEETPLKDGHRAEYVADSMNCDGGTPFAKRRRCLVY